MTPRLFRVVQLAVQLGVISCTSFAEAWVRRNNVCSVKYGQAHLKYH